MSFSIPSLTPSQVIRQQKPEMCYTPSGYFFEQLKHEAPTDVSKILGLPKLPDELNGSFPTITLDQIKQQICEVPSTKVTLDFSLLEGKLELKPPEEIAILKDVSEVLLYLFDKDTDRKSLEGDWVNWTDSEYKHLDNVFQNRFQGQVFPGYLPRYKSPFNGPEFSFDSDDSEFRGNIIVKLHSKDSEGCELFFLDKNERIKEILKNDFTKIVPLQCEADLKAFGVPEEITFDPGIIYNVIINRGVFSGIYSMETRRFALDFMFLQFYDEKNFRRISKPVFESSTSSLSLEKCAQVVDYKFRKSYNSKDIKGSVDVYTRDVRLGNIHSNIVNGETNQSLKLGSLESITHFPEPMRWGNLGTTVTSVKEDSRLISRMERLELL